MVQERSEKRRIEEEVEEDRMQHPYCYIKGFMTAENVSVKPENLQSSLLQRTVRGSLCTAGKDDERMKAMAHRASHLLLHYLM